MGRRNEDEEAEGVMKVAGSTPQAAQAHTVSENTNKSNDAALMLFSSSHMRHGCPLLNSRGDLVDCIGILIID